MRAQGILVLGLFAAVLMAPVVAAQEDGERPRASIRWRYPPMPDGRPPVLEIPDATAATEAEMKRYRDRIPGTEVAFDLVPIPGGAFQMGSPEAEAQRQPDEGPPREVSVAAFWMGRCEVSWDEYSVFQSRLDLEQRDQGLEEAVPQDAWADAITRPTAPYLDLSFGMGLKGYPAICMTQFAARQYTKWLSHKTGRFYRLPTEAEWEYACRAGTTTRYSFGDEVEQLGKHAWFFDNTAHYQKVGRKPPNPWGLCDMHGNVAEWVLDQYLAEAYKVAGADDPVVWPVSLYPRVVRGGSFEDEAPLLRSAARRASEPEWSRQDPHLPKSIWHHTDAAFVGFRLVRPLTEPPREDWARIWDADVQEVHTAEKRQRRRS